MIFDRLFESRSVVDPAHPRDPALAEMFGFGQLASTGVRVTPETAMQESAVASCVKVISEDIGKLPLFVYQRMDGGGKRRAVEHPLYDILHTAPNRNQTSMEWRETNQACVLLRGNAVSKIIANGGRGVAELQPLHPDRLRIFKTTSGRRAYEHTPEDGPREILLADEVLHVPGLSFDGISGLNPIQYHRETIGLALGLKEFGAKLFKNGATSSIVVSHPGALKPEQLKQYRENIEAATAGRNNWHRPMVFEGGAKVERLSMSPEDSQFLESRKYGRSEICGLFRVPPHKIADLERSTNNNIEHQSIEYVVDCLMPWLVRSEQAMTRWLLTEKDRVQGYFVQFEVKGLLRGDAVARSQYYRERFNTGSLSPDDIRRLEDEDPISQTGSNKYYIGVNLRALDEPLPPQEVKGKTNA